MRDGVAAEELDAERAFERGVELDVFLSVRSLRWRMPSAEMNSVVSTSAPCCLAELAEDQVRHARHGGEEQRGNLVY